MGSVVCVSVEVILAVWPGYALLKIITTSSKSKGGRHFITKGGARGSGIVLKGKVCSALVLALLLAQPATAATYPVNVPYGRSWPLSVVVDSARGLAYVDATSGEYPPRASPSE